MIVVARGKEALETTAAETGSQAVVADVSKADQVQDVFNQVCCPNMANRVNERAKTNISRDTMVQSRSWRSTVESIF